MDNLKDEFTVVSIDESFFFYDLLVRKVWIGKDERPIVRIRLLDLIRSQSYFWCYQFGRKANF
jgi:hypothetical protein